MAGTAIPDVANPTHARRRSRFGRYVLWGSWIYAAIVLVFLTLIRWVGDDFWAVPLLLFMPRGVLLLPVLLAAAISAAVRCRWHWVLQGVTALVVAGPLMGVSLPLGRWIETTPEGERLRVATFNMGVDPVRVGRLKRWVKRERIDVICFQEGVRDDPAFVAFLAEGWYVSTRKAVVSRYPIVADLPTFADAWDTNDRHTARLDRVRVRMPSGREVLVASVHLPTLRPGIHQFLQTRDPSALRQHTAWWGHEVERVLASLADSGALPMVLAGDFNMPSDDATMAALRLNFRFAFEEAGWGYGFTRPSRWPWVRIDHVLASPEWSPTSCRVGPDFGSDHLPMLAELVLTSNEPAATRATP